MKKTLKDGTVVGDFVVPANVKDRVERIEQDARDTYTDHASSQAAMVREHLILALSEVTAESESLRVELMTANDKAWHWRDEYERVTA